MEIKKEVFLLTSESPVEIYLWKELAKNYSPLIETAKDCSNKILNLSSKIKSESCLGEIFIISPELYYYYHIPKNKKSIEIGALDKNKLDSNSFEKFIKKIKDIIINYSSEKIILKTIPQEYPFFEILKKEAENFIPEVKEKNIVLELNFSLREILKKISLTKSIFLQNLSSEYPGEIHTKLQKLEELKLIKKDFVIFSQEKVEQKISLTLLGEKFSQTNYYLLLKLYNIFEKYKIDPSLILILEESKYKIINCFVLFKEKLLFFEIKEELIKNSDISYLNSKINFYKPFYTFLISSISPAVETLFYLNKVKNNNLYFYENIEKFEEEFPLFLEKINLHYIKENLLKINENTYLNLSNLILELFYPIDKKTSLIEIKEGIPPLSHIEVEELEKIIQASEEQIPLKSLEEKLIEELPQEIIPQDALFLEKNKEELLKTSINKILEYLKLEKINWQEVDYLLEEISQIENISACILTQEGLFAINHLKGNYDNDIISSWGYEVYKYIQDTLQEIGILAQTHFMCQNKLLKFDFYANNKELILLILNEKKELEKASLFIEKNLNLKEIFQEFLSMEDVKGVMLTDKHGLIIEEAFRKDCEKEALSAIVNSIILKAQEFFKILQIPPAEQLLIKNPLEIYSIIPSENELFLITFLENKTSADLWIDKIPQTAKIIFSNFC